MMILSEVTSGLIVGGKSTRFGSSKQVAIWKNKRLVDYSVELAAGLTHHCVAAIGNLELYLGDRVVVLPDVVKNAGPLGGIATILEYSKTGWVLTIPCDLPQLHRAIYEELWRHTDGGKPVVAVSHRGMEPLVAFWPVDALALIKKNLQHNRLSVQKTLAEAGAFSVNLPQVMSVYREEWFININTLNDLAQLESGGNE